MLKTRVHKLRMKTCSQLAPYSMKWMVVLWSNVRTNLGFNMSTLLGEINWIVELISLSHPCVALVLFSTWNDCFNWNTSFFMLYINRLSCCLSFLNHWFNPGHSFTYINFPLFIFFLFIFFFLHHFSKRLSRRCNFFAFPINCISPVPTSTFLSTMHFISI